MRNTFLFLHIGGLLILAMGVGASVACKLAALRSDSPMVVRFLLRAASVTTHKATLPGSFILLASGIGLVAISNGAYSMHEPWIAGALALWLASAFVGIKLHAPRARRSREIAEQLEAADQPVDANLRESVRRGIPVTLLDTALLAGMVWFMVFKPSL